MLARSKLNSIDSKISEALINNEIIHEDFTTLQKIENWKKALELWIVKEMMPEKMTWLKKEKIDISEVIKRNEITNNSLKKINSIKWNQIV